MVESDGMLEAEARKAAGDLEPEGQPTREDFTDGEDEDVGVGAGSWTG